MCQRSKKKIQVYVWIIQRIKKIKAIELEVSIIDKIIFYIIVDRGNRLNIMSVKIIKKLGLSIIGPSLYIINLTNESQNTSLGQFCGCRVITNSEKYVFIFHVIHMHTSKNSYHLL